MHCSNNTAPLGQRGYYKHSAVIVLLRHKLLNHKTFLGVHQALTVLLGVSPQVPLVFVSH